MSEFKIILSEMLEVNPEGAIHQKTRIEKDGVPLCDLNGSIQTG